MLLAVAGTLHATPEEDREFAAAKLAFQDDIWQRAAREFEQFTIRYPLSPRMPEAVLLQARSLLNLGDASGAETILREGLSQAGALADEYLFWIAEALFRNRNYPEAATNFARVIAEHPGSHRVLEAQVGQAASLGRLKQWGQVVTLLRKEGAPLAVAMADGTSNAIVARGQLLLAEALLTGGDPAGAEAAATVPQLQGLDPVLEWQRQELLARIWLGAGRPEDALKGSSNLLVLAESTGRPALRAEALLLRGRVFETLGDIEASAAAYRTNLAAGVPGPVQRQTLLRLADLLIASGRLTEARAAVEQFLALEPDPAGVALARITVGELKLRQYLQLQAGALTQTNPPAGAATNLLEQAAADFAQVLQSTTDPLVLSRASLDQGWVQWQTDDFVSGAASFARAAAVAEDPRDEAVARFKWADCLFRLGDFEGARTNYQQVGALARAAAGWVAEIEEPALYQAIRAAIAENQAETARTILAELLYRFPDGFHAGSSALLTGQSLERQGRPEAARDVFEQFLSTSPDTAMAAEIRMAIARTYEAQQQWAEAIAEYEKAATQTQDETLIARADYFRAQATALSGDEPGALTLFTNVITRFPKATLTARAQWWIAEHYWRQGDYENAELNYQLLFRNWPRSALAYDARMMAGRAAMARVSFADAINYFTNLTSDLSCPPALKAQALFAYGDALMRARPADTNKPNANYELALEVFRDVERLYPTNELAARASGMVGNCHLTLAESDPSRYIAASNAYQKVLQMPRAGVAVRSEAEYGLATVLEKLAAGREDSSRTNLLDAALDHYLNVLYGTILREGETADPSWTRKAGIEAGRIAESLQRWTEAKNIYETLLELLPSLRTLLENKMLKAQEQAARART